jgi:hypothetical protein
MHWTVYSEETIQYDIFAIYQFTVVYFFQFSARNSLESISKMKFFVS